jgi:hypothetical protein
MAGARAYACSVYTTTFVMHALHRFAAWPKVARTLELAAKHLRAERNLDGSWSYEGRATRRVPPDLDDTACAAAALCLRGERPGLGFFRLLWENESAPGGPYFTWVGVNSGGHLLARQTDALVNVNVLLCAALAGQALPGVVAYLGECCGRDLAEASVFCLRPDLLVYCLARACADGPVPTLAPTLRVALAQLPAAADPFGLACRATALVVAGEGAAAVPLLEALLDTQSADGAWPVAAAYSGYPPYLDGSPALTTALALDALGRLLDEWVA